MPKYPLCPNPNICDEIGMEALPWEKIYVKFLFVSEAIKLSKAATMPDEVPSLAQVENLITLHQSDPNAHHSKLHKDTHKTGGIDAFTIDDMLDCLARVRVSKNGTAIGARRNFNFIEGSNITLTIIDNPDLERLDITIAATGGGGGGFHAIEDPNFHNVQISALETNDLLVYDDFLGRWKNTKNLVLNSVRSTRYFSATGREGITRSIIVQTDMGPQTLVFENGLLVEIT